MGILIVAGAVLLLAIIFAISLGASALLVSIGAFIMGFKITKELIILVALIIIVIGMIFTVFDL